MGTTLERPVKRFCPLSFSFTVQQSLQQNFQNYFLGQVALASCRFINDPGIFHIKGSFSLARSGIMTLIPLGCLEF